MSVLRRWEIPGGPGEARRLDREYNAALRAHIRQSHRLTKQDRYDEALALERPSRPRGSMDEFPPSLHATFAVTALHTAWWRATVGIGLAVLAGGLLVWLLVSTGSVLGAVVVVLVVAAASYASVLYVREFRRYAARLDGARRR
jgi:hypothetical protein